MRASRGRVHALLAALTVAAFAVGIRNQFTNWDDPTYITENRLIRGLSAARVAFPFGSFYFDNYNPLHLVSYMLDHSLWGLNPAGFFALNVLLHLGAALLAHDCILALGAGRFTAVFAAMVFAVHPTRCESVVWLSERKDVLMAFFALAALRVFIAYLRACPEGAPRATRNEKRGIASPPASFPLALSRRWNLRPTRPRPRSAGARSRGRVALYAASLFLFALALLSKSQVVTLPLALWGFSVSRRRSAGRALVEQLPFLLLSALFTIVTLKAHGDIAASGGSGVARLLNPLVALPDYILHAVFPLGLSPLYVRAEPDIHSTAAILRGLLTLGVVGGLLWPLRTRPAVRGGALWFVALWMPVSGLVGNTVLVADRYLYLPLLGVAWIAGDLLESSFALRWRALSFAGLSAAFVVLTARYTTVWRDSETLWTRVLRHEPDSALAQANLGAHYRSTGRVEEARALFEEDLSRAPFMSESFFGLAEIERGEGRIDEALSLYRRLLARTGKRPDRAILRFASFLIEIDRSREALAFLEAQPPSRPSYLSETVLFRASFELGHLAEARECALRAVARNPFHEEGRYHLGLCLERLGDRESAVRAYRKAIDLEPDFQEAREALGSLLYRGGRSREALRILRLAPRRPASWWNLVAACLLDLDRREAALGALRQSIRLAPRNPGYLLNHARLALDLEKRDEARASLLRALELSPDLVEGLEPALRELASP